MKLHKRGSPYTFAIFTAVAGALLLTATFAPKANAQVLRPIVYFDFENGMLTSVAAPGPGNLYPFLQTTTITKVGTSFSGSGGHFLNVDSNLGTNTVNPLTAPGYTSLPRALATGGQTEVGKVMGVSIFTKDCFQFSVNTTGYSDLSLSFALNSVGNGYTGIQINYSTDGGATFTNVSGTGTTGTTTLQIGSIGSHAPETFANITSGGYNLYNFDISGAGNTSNAIIEICLSGSTNSDSKNTTLFDNIQVNANVPEPSTYIGGFLGIGVVCWYQRRWLTRCLRLRRA